MRFGEMKALLESRMPANEVGMVIDYVNMLSGLLKKAQAGAGGAGGGYGGGYQKQNYGGGGYSASGNSYPKKETYTDWASFAYKYELPYHISGKSPAEMTDIRKSFTPLGFKFRGAKTRQGAPIPGGDNCWYGNTPHPNPELEEFCTRLKETATPQGQQIQTDPYGDDDIPF